MKNKYIKVAKFSEEKFRLILKCFSNDITASQTSKLVKLNRNTINRVYALLRKRIFELESNLGKDSGYFWVRWKLFWSKKS